MRRPSVPTPHPLTHPDYNQTTTIATTNTIHALYSILSTIFHCCLATGALILAHIYPASGVGVHPVGGTRATPTENTRPTSHAHHNHNDGALHHGIMRRLHPLHTKVQPPPAYILAPKGLSRRLLGPLHHHFLPATAPPTPAPTTKRCTNHRSGIYNGGRHVSHAKSVCC